MPKAAQAIETPTPRKHGPKPKAEELAVTTVRLRPDQWQWLKKAAFERALQGPLEAGRLRNHARAGRWRDDAEGVNPVQVEMPGKPGCWDAGIPSL